MTAPKVKRCPRCGHVKPASAFYRRRGGARTSPYCQPCTRAASHEARNRRRGQNPAAAELLRAVDRTRQRRRRALRAQPPPGGDAA
jgi:recombinational DNA repair protein (RecF pathway)